MQLIISERQYNKLYENINQTVIGYHRTNSPDKIANNGLSLKYADDKYSIFGKALYFSSKPDISNQFGKSTLKFEIYLQPPLLNMNKQIKPEEANKLLYTFAKRYSLEVPTTFDKDYNKIPYSFNEYYYSVMYGEFFLELSEIFNAEGVNANAYFYDFIHNYLNYNSFYHFQNYHTDFIEKKGDYGYAFGVYDNSNVKFIRIYS